ncbi:histidine utilization repressor [Caulobacter sp. BK020]|uniref:histidine utilization repressor n=1 Tax=Caulobacter sp. BK020 TaxID=2512117 RepID=UPI001042DF60|nr:histidine utilization repressor [Caulobacter sp. BK020]TCS13590.1 GntR family transcriptional regulator [Caulobacter sp. BK020]
MSGAEGTLSQRIRGEIEDLIRSGAWAPGRKVPSELELMGQFGCSRMTVNKAMSALADEGLIVRRRRAGSFVARPRVHSAVLDIPDIQAEIVARGEAYRFDLLDRRRREARAEEAALAGDLLALRGLHVAGDRPFALEDRLISLAAVPEAAGLDFADESPGAWLLHHVPWTEAENRISAVGASGEEARLLALDEGAALLAVERRTWRAGEPVTWVRQLFPGEAYDLVARFGPAR